MRSSYKVVCVISVVLTVVFLSNRLVFLKQPAKTYSVRRGNTAERTNNNNINNHRSKTVQSSHGSSGQFNVGSGYRSRDKEGSGYRAIVNNNYKQKDVRSKMSKAPWMKYESNNIQTDQTSGESVISQQGDLRKTINTGDGNNKYTIRGEATVNNLDINKQQGRNIEAKNSKQINPSNQDNKKSLQNTNQSNSIITEPLIRTLKNNSISMNGQSSLSMTALNKTGSDTSKSLAPNKKLNTNDANNQRKENSQHEGNLKRAEEETMYEEISIPYDQKLEIMNRNMDRNTGAHKGFKINVNNNQGEKTKSVNKGVKSSEQHLSPQQKLNISRDVQFVLNGPQKSISLLNESKDTLRTWFSKFQNNNMTSQFKNHAMNALLSRRIPLDRPVKETRSTMCINKYGQYFSVHEEWKYKKISIVIPFHNEEYSIFLRGLHSIYQRTPDWLIHEVILVDDQSTFDNLKQPFENYVKVFPKLKLYRTNKREGLIRSRLLGAMLSTGDVLVFLDAHIECQNNWLEPLIDMINNKPSAIAVPTVDFLDPTVVTYKAFNKPQYGTFSWELDFVWKDIAWNEKQNDVTKPLKSATMFGCAFAITRETFFNLGSYDEYMNIWGGENLELSFRIWLCGGGLYLSPCSHVGHLFRAYLPYHFPIGDHDIFKNLQRVAETWMGEYKKYYYSTVTKTIALSDTEQQTLSSRIKELSSLKCKSFDWYLNNIVSGVDIPPVTARLFGQVKNAGNFKCLLYDKMLTFEECSVLHPNQTFYYDTHGHLIHLKSNKCIGLDKSIANTDRVVLSECGEASPYQKWLFDPLPAKGSRSKLQGVDTRRPMGVFRLQFGNYQNCLTELKGLQPCGSSDSKNYKQFWIFTHKMKNL